MTEQEAGSGLTGALRLTLSIAVTLVAGLAVLLVFDVIPEDIFSEGIQKIGLLVLIVILAGGVLALIARVGKS